MKKILFQGDSITDAMRWHESDAYRGSGYATLVTAALGTERPGEFEFINRGVSGNRIVDLLARIKHDVIQLAPDYLSILVGVNDMGYEFLNGESVDTEYFEIYYNLLVRQVKTALPDVRIMILEPFLLRVSSSDENWEKFKEGVTFRAAAAKRVAEQNHLIFVPLMEKFEEALKLAPAEYWSIDGIHPTTMGHELIKREWLKGFKILESSCMGRNEIQMV